MKISTKPKDYSAVHKAGQCLYRSNSSNIYYAILRRSGKQIKRSLKTADKELAKRRLEELRQKVARLNTQGQGAILFSDLAQRWLAVSGTSLKVQSKRRRETAIKMISPYFKNAVRSIGKTDVEHWAAQRTNERAARTFNIERETLIQVLDYAVREGLILENPARVVKRRKQPKAEVVIPSKAEFKTLVEEIRKLDARASEAADLVEFLAYSGCRLGEATSMKWGNIDFNAKRFTVTGGETLTKNLEVRVIPLFAPLEGLLRRMLEGLAEAPQRQENIFTIGSAKTAIASACSNAGLRHFTHHSFRHFFCSNCIEAGCDFKVIAGWLGHKDGGMLAAKTYGHLRDEHSTEMAKLLTFSASTA